MANQVVILGAGGFAREVYWHLLDAQPGASIVFAADLFPEQALKIGNRTVPVIRDWKFPAGFGSFLIGVGDPGVKRTLVTKALAAGLRPAPTLVHPRALVQGGDCAIGVGGVITPGCVVTTNVRIGDYVVLNLNSTVGHDARVGDYVTCNPGCQISGNVTLGDGANLGTGTVVRQGIAIAPGVVSGAQACVVKDIAEQGVTVVGVPAARFR